MATDHAAGTAERRIHTGELRAVTLSFVYFFCVLAAYYILRPVREQLFAAVGITLGSLAYGQGWVTVGVLTGVALVSGMISSIVHSCSDSATRGICSSWHSGSPPLSCVRSCCCPRSGCGWPTC